MARVKTARTTRARHKKILKQAKGYYGAKHYRFRNANQAVMKSLSYAYVGRKDKKSNFRKLWIADTIPIKFPRNVPSANFPTYHCSHFKPYHNPYVITRLTSVVHPPKNKYKSLSLFFL